MRLLARILTAGTLVALPIAARAQTPNVQTALTIRVACFSAQRAFAESAEGKAALARLNAVRTDKARAIDEKNRALKAMEQSGRTSEVEKLRIDVQRFVEDAQAELLGIQRDTENAFAIRLKPALAKVAEDKALGLVFNVDEGAVAWFDPKLDITADVVKQMAAK